MKKASFKKNPITALAFTALAAASIECGKLALSAIPNVEIVTLLCALYGYCLGGYGIVATIIFVCIEPLIYGFGTWTISYFLYWPMVALVFCFFKKANIQSRLVFTLAAIALTVWFGLLTSLVDTGLFSGVFESFFSRFKILYLRGLVFYALQIGTNAVLFPILFKPLSKRLSSIINGF